jgi:hypothetical protein
VTAPHYRVVADTDTTPDLVSAHAAPGDRLVYDVIDDDRWSLVRIERPVEGAEPSVQPPNEQASVAVAARSAGKASAMVDQLLNRGRARGIKVSVVQPPTREQITTAVRPVISRWYDTGGNLQERIADAVLTLFQNGAEQ